MRILILDDAGVRHEFFRGWLQPQGHVLVEALTAAEAITTLDGGRFDVAFLDHDLGAGPDGKIVASHIVKMSAAARPNLVVVHSANTVAALAMVLTLRLFGVATSSYPFPDLISDRPSLAALVGGLSKLPTLSVPLPS